MTEVEPCVYCGEPLLPDDPLANGVVGTAEGPRRGHIECALRMVMGGWGHHVDHQLWCVERHDPDGGLTYRESAKKVWRYHDPRADRTAKDADAELCGCGHPRSMHWRDQHSCMASTEIETWACECPEFHPPTIWVDTAESPGQGDA